MPRSAPKLLLLVGLLLSLAHVAGGESRHCGYIYGIHFWSSSAVSMMNGKGGWTVENMQSNEWSWNVSRFQQIYNSGFTIICRLNYRAGYAVPGTNDEAGRATYAAECAQAVQNLGPYCHIWIIGNECNLPGEGNIDPAWYAKVYSGATDGNTCWDKIHAVQPHAIVLVAGIANWAPDFGYGDWKQYTRNTYNALDARKVDGFSVHTYGEHSSWGSEVDPRYDGEVGFQSYRYFVQEIDRRFPDRPIYITETNTAANGTDYPPQQYYNTWIQDWMQKAFQEINAWNSDKNDHKINCLCWFVHATGFGWDSFALESNSGSMPDARGDFSWTTANTSYVNTGPGAGAVRIEAEDYTGGTAAQEGADYHDTTSGNSGGAYRTQDVDIEPCSEGGYDVGWIRQGEWLRYVFEGGGDYAVSIRYATLYDNRSCHLELDGVNVTGPIALPKTGGWQDWATAYGPTISIPFGSHSLKLVAETDSFNANYITLTPIGVTRIEAEDYTGGSSAAEGVDYHDTTSGNAGGVYRTQSVDIGKRSDSGYYVGWLADGEWLRYAFTSTAGNQWVTLRYSAWAPASCSLTVDGVTATSAIYLPSTGGSQNWADFTVLTSSLPAGNHMLKLIVNPGGAGFNLDYLLIRPSNGSAALGAPTMLAPTDVTSTTITWNWTPVLGATAYRLHSATDSTVTITGATSYTETCSPGTSYTRHVHASNFAGTGPASNPVTQSTLPASGTLAGQVTDSGGLPVPGATVSTTTGGYSGTTDSSGNYSIPNVIQGSYTAVASKAGYSSRNRAVTVNAFATTTADFSLSPTPALTGLINPGFETGDLTGWTPWGRQDGVQTGSWWETGPHTGNCFFGTVASYDHKDGGIYQRFAVTKGVAYTVSAWIYTRNSGTASDTQARLGIDPTGGTDPNSSAIQWTAWNDSQSAWKPISLRVTSQAGAMTVFLQNWEKWNVQLNLNAWDDVSVAPVAESFTSAGVLTEPYVRPGWNLVSLPAFPQDANPEVVLAGLDIGNSSLQYWNNTQAGGGWVGYPMEWEGPL